ncbi:MAG: pyridoxal phosphate-dependent aminotransferase [Candidatus Aenigmatarchaeota archaeon]
MEYGKFLNTDLAGVPESPLSELARKAQGYSDAISLGRGEPDFDMPDFMKAAMVQALEDNQTHYAAAGSIPGLNEAIAAKLLNDNGLEADPKFGVVVGAGSSPVLQAVIAALLNPGEEIILMDPTYLMYIPTIKTLHGRCNFIPVFEENNFAPSKEDLEKRYTPKSKAVLINSPCNPTGGVFTKRQLEEIADFATEKDLIVISDEIYENIVYDGAKHHSIGSFDGMAERTITVNGFSKSYAMTGLRVGYAAGPVELMRNVFKFNYFGHICACVPSMYAALEGLRNPKSKDFIIEQVREYDRRRKFIVKRLDEIGLHTKMPQGAFYAFARCDGFDKNSYSFVNRVLDETHVITTPGSAFGPHGEGFVRFSYATKYEQIEESMGRIEKFLERED